MFCTVWESAPCSLARPFGDSDQSFIQSGLRIEKASDLTAFDILKRRCPRWPLYCDHSVTGGLIAAGANNSQGERYSARTFCNILINHLLDCSSSRPLVADVMFAVRPCLWPAACGAALYR